MATFGVGVGAGAGVGIAAAAVAVNNEQLQRVGVLNAALTSTTKTMDNSKAGIGNCCWSCARFTPSHNPNANPNPIAIPCPPVHSTTQQVRPLSMGRVTRDAGHWQQDVRCLCISFVVVVFFVYPGHIEFGGQGIWKLFATGIIGWLVIIEVKFETFVSFVVICIRDAFYHFRKHTAICEKHFQRIA